MLRITIPASEFWDEKANRFIDMKEQTLTLEHSLLSVSKWEAKWKKAYLGKEPKTRAEQLDYIRCMTCTPNIDPKIYLVLTPENYKQILDYISDPMTATTFRETPGDRRHRNHTTTSEELYFQMAAFGIPFECEKWHLNRLLTLLRIASIRNTPPKKGKKRSKDDIAKQYAELNARRTHM